MNYDEKKNALFMKNQLIFLNNNELIKNYSNNNYEVFLDMTIDLLNNDQFFITSFKETSSRLIEVINSNRYKNRKNCQIENSIIILLNKLKSIDEKAARENYRELNEEIRMVPFEDDIELLKSIGNDIVLVSELEKNSNEIDMDENRFISSTAFLLESFTEVYIKNPRALEKTKNYLSNIKRNNNKILMKKVKILNKALKKI